MKRLLIVYLLIVSLISTGQVNLTLGLRAYYPFSGNDNDASGNNNNPVFNNATLTSDRLGNPNSAYHFNGINNFIQIPNSSSLNTSNQLTLSAWIKPTGFYGGTCHGNSILMKGDGDFLPGNYFLRFDDAAFTNNCSTPVDILHQNFYGINVGSPAPGYSPYIQVNQWYNIIVTNNGTTSNLYINCILIATTTQSSTDFNNIYDLFLGRLNSGAYPYWLNGDLDEVRIYDRAINYDEVKPQINFRTPQQTQCLSNLLSSLPHFLYHVPMLAVLPGTHIKM